MQIQAYISFEFGLFLFQLVNKEMFWVVTEICSEPNLVKRTKLLKHFIKIASKFHSPPFSLINSLELLSKEEELFL